MGRIEKQDLAEKLAKEEPATRAGSLPSSYPSRDFDFNRFGFGPLGFRQADMQDSVLKLGRDLRFIDRVG